MLVLKKGQIFLNGKPCEDPYKIFYSLKDLSELKEITIDLSELIIEK